MNSIEQAIFMRASLKKMTVTLSGNRGFNVSVGDIPKALCWTPTTPVEIEKVDDEIYAYIIRRVHYPHDELRANKSF